MGHNYSTTITPDRERGQHLKFEDRVSIKIYRQQGHSLRSIADAVGCSPSTVMYELKRGTPERNGDRGRLPSYSAKRGQANYETNRKRCHRNAKTLYAAVWSGKIDLTPFDLPEALLRNHKKNSVRKNKRIYGTSIEERPAEISERVTEGHWEIDTVIGKRTGKESVVLTLVEKKTDYYMAIKIPGKDADSVMAAIEVLREEYGEEHFHDIFKSVTADNGSEFSRLSELEAYGVSVYFAHPYSSSERPQNERHNRIFRRVLGYRTPEELFDEFLDQVYSIDKVRVA